MVTARTGPVTEGDHIGEAPRPRACVYCPELIVWMRTYLGGRSFCFDAAPVPVSLDDGTGWVPGGFLVGGKRSMVLAPLTEFPREKRHRVQNVMHLHRCRGRRRT